MEDDSFSDKENNESTFEQYFRSRPKQQGESIMCGYDIKGCIAMNHGSMTFPSKTT